MGSAKRLVFDTGPFLLLFTREEGFRKAREAVVRHEKGEFEIYIHPNNLAEAYRIISLIRNERPKLLERDVAPEVVVRSAYATLNVVSDEETTVKLGSLKLKYPGKPWGDLSAAALALRLAEDGSVPIVVLDGEKHLDDVAEVKVVRVSEL